MGNPNFGTDGSLDSLLAIRLSIIGKLQEADAQAPYKPTYTVDGQSVSWNEYRDSLTKQLADIETRIRRANNYNLPGKAVAYRNDWRGTFGRSPYVGGSGGQW